MNVVVAHKLVAAFLAIVMFATTIHCVCGSVTPAADSASSCEPERDLPVDCCAGQADTPADSDSPYRPHEHSPSCNHCESSVVVVDSSKTIGLKAIPSELSLIVDVSPSLAMLTQTRIGGAGFLTDPHVFVGHPTLLRLHCALNT